MVLIVGSMSTLMFRMFWQQRENLTDAMYRTVQVENQKNVLMLFNVVDSITDLAAALSLDENIYGHIEELPDITDKMDFKSMEIRQNFFKTMLISKLATMGQMEDIYLYSINGKCVHVTRQYSQIEDYDFWEKEWYQNFDRKESSLFFSRQNDNIKLILCRKVRHISSGKLVGYLEISFNLTKEFRRILGETTLGEGYCYYLLQDQQIIDTNTVDKCDRKAPFCNGLHEQVSEIVVDGKKYFMMASPVENTELILLSGMEEQVLLKQHQEQIRTFVVILLVGSIGALGVSFLVARGMSQNIHKLNKAMKEADYHLDIQVEIDSHDEIGMLGESFNKMIGKLQAAYRNLLETELDLKEAQFRTLQAQINPHFLYNTLETIDALLECGRTETISRIVQALSEGFRYSMEDRRSVSLSEELRHVKGYLEIMSIRYDNRFSYEIEAEEKLYSMELPKMVLQPLVENAIIHSVLKIRNQGKIWISCKKTDGMIYLEISDNGLGMQPEMLQLLKERLEENMDKSMNAVKDEKKSSYNTEKRGHIGVQNVDRRLKYFFGERYRMEIDSVPMKKTSFILCIREELLEDNKGVGK